MTNELTTQMSGTLNIPMAVLAIMAIMAIMSVYGVIVVAEFRIREVLFKMQIRPL
jgi:hypothetical protein